MLTPILSRLPDPLRKRLGSTSLKRFVWSLGAASFARLGMLVLSVIVARRYGAEAFGAFTFATGLAMILSQATNLGWPSLATREIPRLLATNELGRLRGLLRAANAVTIAGSTIVSLFIWSISPVFGRLEQAVLLAAILSPPLAMTVLRRQELSALKLSHLGLFFDQGFGAILAALVLLAINAVPFIAINVVYAVTIGIAALCTTVILSANLPRSLREVPAEYEMRSWTGSALPMLLGTISKKLVAKADVLLLAPLSDLFQTGLYGAGFRLTYLLSFPQVVLMTVVTPLFSEAVANSRGKRLRALLRQCLFFTTVTIMPVLIVGLLFAEPIMGLVFGQEFTAAANVLRWLLFGQTANSFALVFSSLLIMGGRERAFATINLAAFGLAAALCLMLIPSLGALGAAIATTVSTWTALLVQIWIGLPILRTNDAGRAPHAANTEED